MLNRPITLIMSELDLLPDIDMRSEIERTKSLSYRRKSKKEKKKNEKKDKNTKAEDKRKIEDAIASIFCDDEESDADIILLKPRKSRKTKRIIGNPCLLKYIQIDALNYKYKDWYQCFPDYQVKLRYLLFNSAWDEFFSMIEKKPYYPRIEDILSRFLSEKQHLLTPPAELLFNAFNILSPDKIRVVIIGQDPYPGSEKINDMRILHATGLSFSIPSNLSKADSLRNIYQNMKNFGHVQRFPDSGNLGPLAIQGCFFVNAALTTFFGSRGAHTKIWKDFTNDLIEYLANQMDSLVFLVWGKGAHNICMHVDPTKHYIITTSHPSPLSYYKTFSGMAYGKFKDERQRQPVTYPPFETIDHFGRVNKWLKQQDKQPIVWDLLDSII